MIQLSRSSHAPELGRLNIQRLVMVADELLLMRTDVTHPVILKSSAAGIIPFTLRITVHFSE